MCSSYYVLYNTYTVMLVSLFTTLARHIGTIYSVVQRLRLANLKLPKNSMLQLACDVNNVKGFRPGEFRVESQETRRNCKHHFTMDCPAMLLDDIKFLLLELRYPSSYRPSQCPTYTSLTSGIKLNGRPFSQGSHCEYVPYVRPRGNQDGVGGIEGSSQSVKVGTIGMFYTFEMTQENDNGEKYQTFVSIQDHPVIDKYHNIYVIEKYHTVELPGFRYVHDPSIHTLIHIDSILGKVKFVPYFNRLDLSKTCVIRMWEVR